MKIIRSAPVLGDQTPDILTVKQTIAHFGFNPGELNDVFDSELVSAIQEFQDEYSIPVSGELGPITLSAMRIMVDPHPPGALLAQAGVSVHTHPIANRRQNRHLHPTLREKLDHAVLGSGLPVSFQKKIVPDMICDVARGFATLGIIEHGDNHGTDVGFIQAVIGGYTPGGNGDSWCMSTVQCIAAYIEDFLQRESLMPAGENCVDVYSRAVRIKGLVSASPIAGSFWIGRHGLSSKGHTGTVIAVNKDGSLHTFEGNRNNKAMIGDRNARHTGDLETLGFVKMF